jgi:hypothetical protein
MFEKVKLREGLMGRVERKYCDEGQSVIVLPEGKERKGMSSFVYKINKKVEPKKTRFSIGNRVGR